MSDPRTTDPDTSGDEALPPTASVSLDRFSSFLLVFGAIMLFLSCYLITVQFVEKYLQLRFDQVVGDAIRVRVSQRPPGPTIRRNLIDTVDDSEWVRFWGADVDVTVLARDGVTWLYVDGRVPTLRYPSRDSETRKAIHATMLPATATVRASIGHNTKLSNLILAVPAMMLFIGLFVFSRHVAHLQDKALDGAHGARDLAASKARRIEAEIDLVRAQLREVEPAKREHREEIERLQSEQRELQVKLDALAARENELRGQADRAGILEEDGVALEELLEEATRDLDAKNTRIRELEKKLKREGRTVGAARGRSKDSELLAKRLSFLYPNVEIDSRAIDDLIDLREEPARLRAEECIKRLSDDADNAPVRRKVTGLPSHLSIYEMGFAGKRRVYFERTPKGRFRVLVIGAKNTQQNDLDYLARIPKA